MSAPYILLARSLSDRSYEVAKLAPPHALDVAEAVCRPLPFEV